MLGFPHFSGVPDKVDIPRQGQHAPGTVARDTFEERLNHALRHPSWAGLRTDQDRRDVGLPD